MSDTWTVDMMVDWLDCEMALSLVVEMVSRPVDSMVGGKAMTMVDTMVS